MHARIATLNIRQGGAKAAEALTSRLLGYGADLLVVNEFSANAAGAQLISRLESAGYTSAHPSVDRRHNTVLVASRRDLTPHGTFTSNGLDPRHLMVRPRRRDRGARRLHASRHRQTTLTGSSDLPHPAERNQPHRRRLQHRQQRSRQGPQKRKVRRRRGARPARRHGIHRPLAIPAPGQS